MKKLKKWYLFGTGLFSSYVLVHTGNNCTSTSTPTVPGTASLVQCNHESRRGTNNFRKFTCNCRNFFDTSHENPEPLWAIFRWSSAKIFFVSCILLQVYQHTITDRLSSCIFLWQQQNGTKVKILIPILLVERASL